MWLICGQFRISTIALEKYKCFGSYPRLFLNESGGCVTFEHPKKHLQMDEKPAASAW
jgi:hypothetical protein